LSLDKNVTKETKDMTQAEEAKTAKKEAFNLREQIGSTTYKVVV
jgi:hypothetical protein